MASSGERPDSRRGPRTRLTRAISGGSGPDSSWAIASGNWAGRGAAEHARRIGALVSERQALPLGRAGVRPADAVREDTNAADIVREEMLPLDRNFFRDGVVLDRPLAAAPRRRLDNARAACSGRGRRCGQGEKRPR
jgi:hypothetical protein